MQSQVQLAAVAFTYAWWLTGEEDRAARAVLAAARDVPVATWTDPDQLPAVLRVVRRVAAPDRTMCPASELALLHDGHGLSLDLAAELTEIPVADARAELAHGRLEALVETIATPFAHPERLGGLAVGNPPDVAHARTCGSCEHAQGLLRKGREELTGLHEVVPPMGLLDHLESAPAPAHREQPAAAPAGDAPSGASVLGETPAEPAPPREIPAPVPSARIDPFAGAEARRRRTGTRVGWLAVAAGLVILAIAAIGGLTALGGDEQPGDQVSPGPAGPPAEEAQPPATDEGTQPPATGVQTEPPVGTEPPPETEPPPFDGPQVEGFAVTDARLVAGDGTTVGPTDPIRVAVDYADAEEVVLEAILDVGDGSTADLSVLLTGEQGSHVFVWQAPPGGWPPGAHEVRLAAEGALVGVLSVPVG